MGYTEDLKVKAQLHVLGTSGEVQLSVFKENNFANDCLVTIVDASAGSDNDNFTGFQVYTTGKEPTNPVGSGFFPVVNFDELWLVTFNFVDAAGELTLGYTIKIYADSTKDVVYPIELTGKSIQGTTT